MPKQITKKVGEGITEREITKMYFSGDEKADGPLAALALQAAIDGAKKRWSGKAVQIENIRNINSLFEVDAPDFDDVENYNSYYVPRVSPAWYFRELVNCIKMTENAVEDKRVWDAVYHAIKIGELITEVCILEDWGEFAIHGKKNLTDLRNAAELRRLHTKKERYEKVREHVANSMRSDGSRISTRRAIKLAADDLGCKPSTINNDYYAYRKSIPN